MMAILGGRLKVSDYFYCLLVFSFILFFLHTQASAVDSELSRQTLADLRGVYVIVEELQQDLQRYAKRQELSKDQLQKNIESQLKAAGVKVLTKEEWLQSPGRPFLYINVNTHEYQKYQFAYDVRVELQQLALLEAGPKVKGPAATWSTNMTGATHIGGLNVIYDSVRSLVAIFIKAYLAVH